MKPGFRAAMGWLHDWSGLAVGWLLFVIALSGTLAVFRAEIGDWARPEAACCVADTAETGTAAVRWLSAHAAHAPAWYIQPADRRSATSYAAWAGPDGGYVQRWLDARTGSPEGIRDTLGGDFFYRLHFELQLPYPWGRLLAGGAAIAMLLTLFTGIVVHRRLFVDFFTFRPGKGPRSWLDLHNMVGVTALPFHLAIAFTGAVTLATLLMPWGAASAFHADARAIGRALHPAAVVRAASGRPAPLAPIRPMLDETERRFGGGIVTLDVFNPGDAAAVVTVVRAEDARIGILGQTLSFDGPSGRLLAADEERRPAVAAANILYGLHTARFAEGGLRWLYFLSGLALAVTIGTGLLLWTAKRRQRGHHLGAALVERLNLGVIGGAPTAFAAFFVANRLLPPGLPHRAELEVQAVFWTWGALLLFAAARDVRLAWSELAALAALACLAIPLLDLGGGFTSGSATVLGVDGVALAFAALFATGAVLAVRSRRGPPVRFRSGRAVA